MLYYFVKIMNQQTLLWSFRYVLINICNKRTLKSQCFSKHSAMKQTGTSFKLIWLVIKYQAAKTDLNYDNRSYDQTRILSKQPDS